MLTDIGMLSSVSFKCAGWLSSWFVIEKLTLVRRSKLIRHLESEIAQRGENAVLFRHGASAYQIIRQKPESPQR